MSPAINKEDILGPRPVSAASLGLIALASIISGFAGGVVNLALVFVILGSVKAGDISLSPYLLSMIAFFSILVTTYLNLVLQKIIFPDKYRHTGNTFIQVSIFTVLVYVLITPIYVYMSIVAPEYVIFVFTLHVVLNTFGTNLVSETLSTYRYILIGVYGAFMSLVMNFGILIAILLKYGVSNTALYGFLGIIIMTNFLSITLRTLFELGYYQLYVGTGWDPLGDIYQKIENEELSSLEETKREMERF